MYQAYQKMPLLSNVRTAQRARSEANNTPSSSEVLGEGINEIKVFGMGLQNETGEYNCFLNVIIQVKYEVAKSRLMIHMANMCRFFAEFTE